MELLGCNDNIPISWFLMGGFRHLLDLMELFDFCAIWKYVDNNQTEKAFLKKPRSC